MCAKEPGQSPDSPLAVYAGRDGTLRYQMNAELSKYIKSAAKAANMHLSPEEQTFISYHSLRVWATVLLSKAEKMEIH